MGYAGLGLLAVVVLASAGAGYLMLNPPVDLIREQVAAQVKARTGRDLAIGGPARLSFYPDIGVTLADVSLSAPPEMGGQPLVVMKGLDVSLKLMPLFSRRIEFDRLVLREPVLSLRTDRAGRRSWDMRPARGAALGPSPERVVLAQAATPNRTTDAPQPGAGRPSRGREGFDEISLSDVRITGGTVHWSDERNGASETVSGINLATRIDSLGGPLALDGDLQWHGERVGIKGALTSLETVLAARPAKLRLALSGHHATLGFDGTLTASDAPAVSGNLEVKASDLAAFAQRAGLALPPALGTGQGEVTGKLSSRGSVSSLDDARIRLGTFSAAGSVGVETGRVRPLLRANLQVDALDLDALTTPAEGAPGRPAPPSAAVRPVTRPAAGPAVPGGAPPASIDDLLDRPAPQVRGYTQRAGWSEETISVAALGAVDAEVKLAAGKVSYRDIKAGASRLSATLKDRVLKAFLEDSEVYAGRAKGSLMLDGTEQVPRLSLSLNADGVSSLPFLTDAAQMKWLAGNAKVALGVNGQGTSQKAIVESLGGSADITFTNGAIVGWNIPQIIRGLQQGRLSGFERVETAKTDFSELSSSWAINRGVARNQDLRMTSPLLRVTGAGMVALGARLIDYQLKSKVVASLDGQGGAQGLAGLEIPLRIKGAWEKPEITPEVGAILNDPDKALGAAKEIGKQFKGKKPNEIVDQVLGKNTEAAKKANDLLGKFLKPKKEAAPAE